MAHFINHICIIKLSTTFLYFLTHLRLLRIYKKTSPLSLPSRGTSFTKKAHHFHRSAETSSACRLCLTVLNLHAYGSEPLSQSFSLLFVCLLQVHKLLCLSTVQILLDTIRLVIYFIFVLLL